MRGAPVWNFFMGINLAILFIFQAVNMANGKPGFPPETVLIYFGITSLLLMISGGMDVWYTHKYKRLEGRRMVYTPWEGSKQHQEDRRGQVATVFIDDKHTKRILANLMRWSYRIQFLDGEETLAHRSELVDPEKFKQQLEEL